MIPKTFANPQYMKIRPKKSIPIFLPYLVHLVKVHADSEMIMRITNGQILMCKKSLASFFIELLLILIEHKISSFTQNSMHANILFLHFAFF